jgi:hypothetical protein
MRHGLPCWIAPELGYATDFPKKNIIPQKTQLDQSRLRPCHGRAVARTVGAVGKL